MWNCIPFSGIGYRNYDQQEQGMEQSELRRIIMGELRRKEQRISSMEQTAMHVSKVSILVNVLLSAGKLAAGIFASSGAMISDAVHSASDVFSTIIVMVGIRISGKAADKRHPGISYTSKIIDTWNCGNINTFVIMPFVSP